MSGLASRQDGTQFEDALRRLHALEKKLTDQVLILLAILKRNLLPLSLLFTSTGAQNHLFAVCVSKGYLQ